LPPFRPTNSGAAVSILETYHRPNRYDTAELGSTSDEDAEGNREVRGLARMVQVSPTVTLVDLTLRGVAPGTYRATIREYGDLKHGASSAGPVWSGASTGAARDERNESPRGALGTVEIGPDGRGGVFLDRPFQVWEVIGHAFVVSRQDESKGAPLQNDENTVVGVVARSAGMWDNDKTICSCTGKTLWEERKDEVKKGML
jgi:copper chaperone for superoxide dismutase